MATFTATFSNSINLFGLAPSTKWGTMLFGTDTWGEGSDVQSTNFSVLVLPSEVEVTDRIFCFELLDQSGYNQVFPGPTIKADERLDISYTEASNPSDGFSLVSSPTNIWTEA